MRRILIFTILLGLAVAACGEPASSAGDQGDTSTLSGSIQRTGGIAGMDETWTFEADGTVVAPDGTLGHLTEDDRATLRSAVDGFFDLDDEYLPADPCCDRFTYTVTLSDGTRSHTVVTMDAADAPAALFSLIQTMLSIAQDAV